MFCKNCGTDIGESNFCPNCGALAVIQPQNSNDIPENEIQSQPTANTEKTTSNFKIRIISFFLTIALLVGIYLVCAFSGSLEKEPEPTFTRNLTSAQLVMEDYLKSPSTAEYSFLDEDWEMITNDNKHVKIESFVNSQNAIGATVRTNFTIIITYKDDYESFVINEVIIDKQKVFPKS